MKQPFSRGKKSYAKPKNTKGTILRLLKYISGYKWQCIVALCGILLSSGAGVAGTYFLKPAIESIVLHKDVTKLIEVLVIMACIYVAGVVGSYTYSYIMRTISMGTMKKIRVDLFNHMQKLPVSFYDGHTNGQLMSLYTNDTDIMREMISQSLPQFISSFLTVVGVFVMMIVLSWQLTILVIFMLVVMLFVVKKVGGKSAQYFKKQQEKLLRPHTISSAILYTLLLLLFVLFTLLEAVIIPLSISGSNTKNNWKSFTKSRGALFVYLSPISEKLWFDIVTCLNNSTSVLSQR